MGTFTLSISRSPHSRTRAHVQQSGAKYAAKVLRKGDNKRYQAMLKQEVEIMELVGKHPNIVSLVEKFENDDGVCVWVGGWVCRVRACVWVWVWVSVCLCLHLDLCVCARGVCCFL